MSFSEAETSLFLKCHENIRRAFIISKLLLDRQVKLPWKILQPDSDDLFGISAMVEIQTRNCITSYILKQSLFNVLMENQHDTETNEESILVWVQRIFSRYRKSLKDGSLQSVFLHYRPSICPCRIRVENALKTHVKRISFPTRISKIQSKPTIHMR